MGREVSPRQAAMQKEEPKAPPDGTAAAAGDSGSGGMLVVPDSLLVDPGHILRCMRIWLTQRSLSGEAGTALSVEEASCELWDFSANEDCAAFMVNNQLLDLLQAVLDSAATAPQRQVETACGVVANLLCHIVLKPCLEEQDSIIAAVAAAITSVDDVAVLVSACSALTSAIKAEVQSCCCTVRGSWQAAVISRDWVSRLLWIADNSLDAELLERALDLVGAVACSSEAAMSMLLSAGMLQSAMGHIQAFCTALGEEEPSSSPSARENVADASLRVIEVVASHQDGVRLLESRQEEVQQSLVTILVWSEIEMLEGSAALTMAAWASPSILRSVLVDRAFFAKVLQLLKDDAEEDARGAAWQLLGAALREPNNTAVAVSAIPAAVDSLTALANEPLPAEREETLKQLIAVLMVVADESDALVEELRALRELRARWQC
eukprot:CAMPEP_0117674272 /NCGR_PEP_ID=MMETSP0804-20121206/14942_1 /TAXON_ID=1074897 /ORGANISM="Tetraselmis astigmatica, Strain CCMP880" /LENGTH=435 /DNA_ID=CAMNT_0005483115 /DNA_START=89 /DNA_END=1396 /DNA_ORIENTATION=-